MLAVRARPIWLAFYAVASLLVLVPLLEIAAGAFPLRPSEMAWRFGTLGILFKSLITPLLGVALAMAVAAVLDHRRVVRALAVLNLVVALGIVASAAVFVLDFLQLRTTVVAGMRAGVDTASVIALAIVALVVPVSASLGIAGWIATRTTGSAPSKARAADAHPGLIISQPKEGRS